MRVHLCLAAIVSIFVSLAHSTTHGQTFDADSGKIDFVRQIEPVLRRRCFSCHGPEKRAGGLRLDLRRNALAGGDGGRVIQPGDSGKSRLTALITESTSGERMPPTGRLLSAAEIQLITEWINAGAVWPQGHGRDQRIADHWSFQPVTAPVPPPVRTASWPRNAIDHFILRRLEEEGTSPSRTAKRQTLIRRVYFDLLGLPPSPRQWQHWMQNPHIDWYSRMVESLLASPHFGERQARIWLDLARYADSDGYEKDRPRPHAYHWRDWVIDALNDDLPFDQFTLQQLAGDLLPEPTATTRLATGFHRNTLTNREGGIDKEEDRVKQTVDRINTVSTVWLGLTLKCAQCHSHKYDPISQREYYRLYAFFNNTDEADFRLPADQEQSAAFQRESMQHAARLETKRKAVLTARSRIRSNLAETTASLLKIHPGGVPAPPTADLKIHASFDRDVRSGAGTETASWRGSDRPVLTNGKSSQALQFNGAGEQLELGQSVKLTSQNPFTISAWIQHAGGIGAIVTKMDEHANFRGVDFTSNQGMLEVHLVDTWPTDAIKVTTKQRVPQDEWHHVMMTWDGSRKASGVGIFIDGQPQELTTHFDQLKGSIDLAEPLRVGSRKSSTFFKGRIDEVRLYTRVLEAEERKSVAGDAGLEHVLQVARIDPSDRTAEQQALLVDFVFDSREPLRRLQSELKRIESNPPKLQQGTGMALKAAPQPRQTHVHIRGEFLNPGQTVHPAVPDFLHVLQARGDQPDRLDLARWIIDGRNPLTARVAVNRIWQQYFGRGLVVTSDDFGTQGAAPTHPQLLDWLATQFVRNQWSLKWLHRVILSSATYRQSSISRPDLADRDPDNTWLGRQNRLRVDAEMVRDLALTASGRLDDRTHGPSVFPPLPPGIIELAFVDVINRGPWQVSSGGDRYRRGLYTFFQRTSPYPMLSLFDAPDSTVACIRRERSNTPLQALTLWNDPVFVECARFLADQLVDTGTSSEDARIQSLFVKMLSRKPTIADRQDIQTLLAASRAAFRRNPELAEKLTGQSDGNQTALIRKAAWTSVIRTTLNLDEFITRE
ncbi:MAG: DUF1553 domain-containing protein [Planctomycetaceae bacterium]